MREPLGAQEELCTSKQQDLLGRQPEPCTSNNLWEHKQEDLWEGGQSPAQVRTFGNAAKALQREMGEH
eukprot:9350110-Karenia_brevis.AAC.1